MTETYFFGILNTCSATMNIFKGVGLLNPPQQMSNLFVSTNLQLVKHHSEKNGRFQNKWIFGSFIAYFSSVDNLLVAISIVLHEFLNQIIIKN